MNITTEKKLVLAKATQAKEYGLSSVIAVLVGAALIAVSLSVPVGLGSVMGVFAVAAFIASPVYLIMSVVASFLASGAQKRLGNPGGGLTAAAWIGTVSLALSWFPVAWVGHIVYLIMIFTNLNKAQRDAEAE